MCLTPLLFILYLNQSVYPNAWQERLKKDQIFAVHGFSLASICYWWITVFHPGNILFPTMQYCKSGSFSRNEMHSLELFSPDGCPKEPLNSRAINNIGNKIKHNYEAYKDFSLREEQKVFLIFTLLIIQYYSLG